MRMSIGLPRERVRDPVRCLVPLYKKEVHLDETCAQKGSQEVNSRTEHQSRNGFLPSATRGTRCKYCP